MKDLHWECKWGVKRSGNDPLNEGLFVDMVSFTRSPVSTYSRLRSDGSFEGIHWLFYASYDRHG